MSDVAAHRIDRRFGLAAMKQASPNRLLSAATRRRHAMNTVYDAHARGVHEDRRQLWQYLCQDGYVPIVAGLPSWREACLQPIERHFDNIF